MVGVDIDILPYGKDQPLKFQPIFPLRHLNSNSGKPHVSGKFSFSLRLNSMDYGLFLNPDGEVFERRRGEEGK